MHTMTILIRGLCSIAMRIVLCLPAGGVSALPLHARVHGLGDKIDQRMPHRTYQVLSRMVWVTLCLQQLTTSSKQQLLRIFELVGSLVPVCASCRCCSRRRQPGPPCSCSTARWRRGSGSSWRSPGCCSQGSAGSPATCTCQPRRSLEAPRMSSTNTCYP